LLLRWVGEDWWVTTIGLYLPQALYLAPLVPLALLLLVVGPRRMLWAVLISTLIVVFPLMGLSLPWPRTATGNAPRMRILSLNVNTGRSGPSQIVDEILTWSADVVVLQEAGFVLDPFVALLKSHYPDVRASDQFVIASRLPIRSAHEPARVPYYGRLRSPRFVHYILGGPLGPLALYNVHPISSRESLAAVRGAGLRRELASGRLFAGENRHVVETNTGLRKLQVQAFARLTTREAHPVVIAGDTNLPTSSALLSRHLSSYQDGFSEIGAGFGYTFPSERPFLRLDRVFASESLRFIDFNVGCRGVSDHLCVVADLARRE
jgi:vancomycin resistance protein VanJ